VDIQGPLTRQGDMSGMSSIKILHLPQFRVTSQKVLAKKERKRLVYDMMGL
jgi:hypothetical protein